MTTRTTSADRGGALLRRKGIHHLAAAAAAAVAALTLLSGTAASAPAREQLTTITLDTLPIANALPLTLGINKGFFAAQGLDIKQTVLQSGNDIVLAMANNQANIGYVGYVPAMIARTTGIPITIIAASEVEGTSNTDNWQDILVKGSSSIQTPAQLAGKSVAVNALKGVGEVVIRAALKKLGVDPNSVNLVAMPFPTMCTALNNGPVDAIWVPEPFLSQGLSLDGDRIVLAPGPTLGRYFPNGGYVARDDWVAQNPQLAKAFQTAMNQSLSYAQAHPEEIRPLLPAGTPPDVKLPIWSPLIDRGQLLTLARDAKEFGVITTLPNFTKLISTTVVSGKFLQATVGPGLFVTLRLGGNVVKTLPAGSYTISVADKSTKDNFHIAGKGLDKSTSVAKSQSASWNVKLAKGAYTIMSDGHPKLTRRTITVS
jgi:NitT/TauT family transport system substrate-binding protein